MSRRLNVSPRMLLAALPLTTMACAAAPPAGTGTAAIVAASVSESLAASSSEDEPASEPGSRDRQSESEVPRSEPEPTSEPQSESDSEGPRTVAPVSASASDCAGMPELSCRVGNTKAPNYDAGDDRS